MNRAAGKFVAFGRAIGLSIKHGCPGPRCLAKCVAQAILNIDVENPTFMDCPEFDLRESLRSIIERDQNEEDVKGAMVGTEERHYTGILYLSDRDGNTISPQRFVQQITLHKILDLCREEIIDVRKGLQDVGMFDILKAYQKDALEELCYKQLSASSLKAMFVPIYNDEYKAVEEDVIFNLCSFCDKMEKKPMKVKASRYDPEKNEVDLENVEESYITLGRILQFATGATMVGSALKSTGIKVLFDHRDLSSGRLVSANTCSLGLSIPCTADYTDEDRFAKKIVEGMLMNSNVFSVA